MCKFGGTGLGLSISRSLVELMDGQIGLESQLNKGNVFWFTLPLGIVPQSPASSGQPPAAVDPAAVERIRGSRLLVVEDNDLNQELANELLTEEGFEVDLAENGAVAVRKAAEQRYDLIFMDMQMPVMDGLDATRAIRAQAGGAHVPIVAMTGNAMREDRDRCLEAGMNDFIAKPFDPDHLLVILVRWIAPR